MSKVRKTNDGYLMLLDAVYFRGLRLGNISEEGIEWAGEDAQTLELWAAQNRTSPVKEVETRAATNEVTGKMIECVAQNLKTLLGGKVDGERWDAPATTMIQEGELKILTGTDRPSTSISSALRTSQLRGGLRRRKYARGELRIQNAGRRSTGFALPSTRRRRSSNPTPSGFSSRSRRRADGRYPRRPEDSP